MRTSVLRAWNAFTRPLEGHLPYMYLDSEGLVTTGDGDLIDPIGAALSLPWQELDGSRASPDRIEQVWNLVKNGGSQAHSFDAENLTGNDLRLSEQAIANLVQSKLANFESQLRERFPSYDAWPADAQLGLLSMAWAMGPQFHFPRFQAAASLPIPDFATMAAESHISNGAPERNADNAQLFNNAARVLRDNLDPDLLLLPIRGVLGAGLTGGVVSAAGAGAAGFIANNPGSAGVGFATLTCLAGLSYLGYRYAKKKGIVK